jgi:hypothetical protein
LCVDSFARFFVDIEIKPASFSFLLFARCEGVGAIIHMSAVVLVVGGLRETEKTLGHRWHPCHPH